LQTHENIIQEAKRDHWINALSFLYYVKCRYKNSCLYNHSLRKTAKKLGISHQCLKNNLDILRSKKLIRNSGNHIIFEGIKTVRKLFAKSKKDKHLCTILLKKNHSLSEIKDLLNLKIIEMNLRQQKHMANLKQEYAYFKLPNYGTIKQWKRLKKKVEYNKDIENAPVNHGFLSDSKLSSILNVSTRTVSKIKKRLKNLKLINYITERPKPLFSVSKRVFNSNIDIIKQKYGSVIWYNGKCFNIFPTEYIHIKEYSKGKRKLTPLFS
jgi:hypothetical protein